VRCKPKPLDGSRVKAIARVVWRLASVLGQGGGLIAEDGEEDVGLGGCFMPGILRLCFGEDVEGVSRCCRDSLKRQSLSLSLL
jgi:hypothetical protein